MRSTVVKSDDAAAALDVTGYRTGLAYLLTYFLFLFERDWVGEPTTGPFVNNSCWQSKGVPGHAGWLSLKK